MFGFLKQKSDHYSIEKLEFSDLQRVSDIHKSSFNNQWDESTIAQTLNSSGISGLVAKSQKPKAREIGAFLIFRTVAREAEVIMIATVPSHRRSGASRALMAALIRHALSERLNEIFLEVDESNFPALALYKSIGFKKVGERKGYYNRGAKNVDSGEPSGNALIMRLDLEA